MGYYSTLEEREKGHRQAFRGHPVLVDISRLSDEHFKQILLQRYALTRDMFMSWYDGALPAIKDEQSRRILKAITREELPLHAPSHREDALVDLVKIGIPEETILTTPLTLTTLDSGKRLKELVQLREKDQRDEADIRIIATCTLGGETLPGDEFKIYCDQLEQRGLLTEKESRFYWPHLGHDSVEAKGMSHSKRLKQSLLRLVDTDEKLKIAELAYADSWKARYQFYDQFKTF
ncbi:MAG: hypothetical protein Q7R96_00205 [Nanoarchaeota archaeon]|nr:hypothetical protein [Nanoarchaeota archaeon]